jgi:hypothetical protein
MRFLTSVVAGLLAVLASGGGSSVAATAAPMAMIAQPLAAIATALDNKGEPKDDSMTLLRFETDNYLVRVYRQEGLTYLNVYNKETGFTDQNGVLAYLVTPESNDDPWRTYANQQGDLEYRAKVNPQGETALEIRLPDGPPARPEHGFNVTYSFPHTYLGTDLDSALDELEAAGWTVDAKTSELVQLTRNQLALDLKFDPVTQVITYTQLIDLT